MVLFLRHLKSRNIASSTALYLFVPWRRVVRTSSRWVVISIVLNTRTVVSPGARAVRKLHELLSFGSRDNRLLDFSSTDHISAAILLRHMNDLSGVALDRVQEKLPSHMLHQNHLIP